VQRLAAVAGASAWKAVRESGAKYLDWARAIDQPGEVRRLGRPEPRPPRAARPTALSVTDIENWLRDPYSIYAKHILRLRELDPVDAPPGAADRGMVIHAALNEFTRTFAAGLPGDPAAALIAIGEKHFAALDDFPEARAIWWPRFKRIAQWFAAWEAQRRTGTSGILSEIDGSIDIPVGERIFKLRARADRIEKLAGGGYAILDYKTGQVPTANQVRIGISPQLTLEAAILLGGGFAGLEAQCVDELAYVSLRGGEIAGEGRTVLDGDDVAVHAARARERLQEVVRRFESDDQPYLPLLMPMWKRRYGTYDHLARIKEWSVGRDEESGPGAVE
jgi:ATP-dependent helicase/nuclease subunit B